MFFFTPIKLSLSYFIKSRSMKVEYIFDLYDVHVLNRIVHGGSFND